MKEFIELYAMFFCGCVFHLFKKWSESYKRKDKFDWLYNMVSFFVSLMLGLMFVYSRDSFKESYPMTLFTSAVLGFSAQSGFLSLVGLYKVKGSTEGDGE